MSFLSRRLQTSDSDWLSPRKLCSSWRQSESRGSATMTRSCCWPSPRLKMYRWEQQDMQKWCNASPDQDIERPLRCTAIIYNCVLTVLSVYVSGGEGMPQFGDNWAETEDSLPAGSAAAPQQTEGIPGEGDPTPQQGQQGKGSIRRLDMCFSVSLICLPSGFGRSLKSSLPINVPTTTWPG